MLQAASNSQTSADWRLHSVLHVVARTKDLVRVSILSTRSSEVPVENEAAGVN